MDTMTIADAAGATGFSASALRFYETAGLVTPARTAAGYRTYADDDLARLRFIGRAKRLGLSFGGDRRAPTPAGRWSPTTWTTVSAPGRR
jgi:MerR family redox-sensitive transcriptional activator SoxR